MGLLWIKNISIRDFWRVRANFVYPDPRWSDSNETKEEIKEHRGDL